MHFKSTEHQIVCVVSAGMQVIESKTPNGLDKKEALSHEQEILRWGHWMINSAP